MNKLSMFAVALLLCFGGVLWYLASADWNGFIKSQIEIHGSELIDQPVTVDKVDLKITEGFGGIYGISFANPSKYSQPKAMYLGEVSLDIDVESLTSSPIILEAITLKKPEAFVEFDKSGNTNIQDLLDAINAKLPSESAPVEVEAKKKNDNKPETMVAINNLVLEGLALTVDLNAVNGEQYDVEIPSINLSSIGGEEGIPVSQLGAEIAKKLLKAIKSEAKDQYEQVMKDKVKDQIEEKKDDLFNSLKKKIG